MNIEGLGTYTNAMECLTELRSHGFDGGVCIGGLTIYAHTVKSQPRMDLLYSLVSKFGGIILTEGESTLFEWIVSGGLRD